MARHGVPGEGVKEACRAALGYAQCANEHREVAAARAALLGAWQAVVLVAFSRRWGAGASGEGVRVCERARLAAFAHIQMLGWLASN